jgi:hypothetical protein
VGETDESMNVAGAEPTTTETPGFSPESLVTCQKCARTNSPLRTTCIYCGDPLPVGDRLLSAEELVLRPPAEWEKGFNVIVTSESQEKADSRAAAALLRLEEEDVRRLVDAGLPAPVIRVSTRTEADLVATRLSQFHFRTWVVSDVDLAPDPAGFRQVRGMELGDEVLSLRTSGTNPPIVSRWAEIALMVPGRFRSRRTEMNERKGKGKDLELIDVRELTSDEPVLDIYLCDGQSGRVAATGFDYSCLGPQKTFATGQNFELLVQELRQRSPAAAFDDTYRSARAVLELAWPLTQRSEALGWKRQGLGKVGTDSALVTNNEQQFTRYSRLRYHLAMAERSSQ